MKAKVLITSGPTRQFLDPVRYLTNASSGQMGAALASAAIDSGMEVVIVSGPVHVEYPSKATIVHVTTTQEMLDECVGLFPSCDGVIGAAAPCDYQVETVSDKKLAKTGDGLLLRLVETPDVIATLGAFKRPDQWAVGFALETHDAHFRAITKLQKKCCDLMVLNGTQAINSDSNSIEILNRKGECLLKTQGPKEQVAKSIIAQIEKSLSEQIIGDATVDG